MDRGGLDHSCVKVASTTNDGGSGRGHHLPPSVKSASSLFCSVLGFQFTMLPQRLGHAQP
jgi:hypothetical protein